MLTDIPTNWNLSSSGSDIADQFFQIIEIIIITHNAFTVINNTGLFISFKAVQECFNTVPSGKFRKSPWLDLFREQSQRISYVYVSMVPRITTIVVGYAASWFFRNSDASSRPYVIWSRWSNWRRPTAFLVGMAIIFLLGIWVSISVIPRFSNRSKLLDVAGSQEFTWEGVHAAECLLKPCTILDLDGFL